MALTIAKWSVEPEVIHPGDEALATCMIEGDEPVESVVLWLPDGGGLTFRDAGGGRYQAKSTVPYDAPAGTWDLSLVARGKSGLVARQTVTVHVA